MTENLLLLQELYGSHQKRIEIVQKAIAVRKNDIYTYTCGIDNYMKTETLYYDLDYDLRT